MPERGLRFKPGGLGHAFQHNGPLDRLERVLRVEQEEDVVQVVVPTTTAAQEEDHVDEVFQKEEVLRQRGV